MELSIYSPLPRRKDFRIGILGSGFIVNDCYLVAYRKAGFNPVAIASRTRPRAAPVFATIAMRGMPHWMDWQKELGWLTLRIMSIHHLDTFRYWFGDPEGIYCSVRPDPRTKFPHRDGICTYILEYRNGLRCVGIDDTWTGPAREGCPANIRIQWRIECTNGLAIGDIGWCKDPYTTPSTIRYAAKGMLQFQGPVWAESWFPNAFIGTMAQL